MESFIDWMKCNAAYAGIPAVILCLLVADAEPVALIVSLAVTFTASLAVVTVVRLASIAIYNLR